MAGTDRYRENARTPTLERLQALEREHSSSLQRAMGWAQRPAVVRAGGPVTFSPVEVSAMADRRGLLHLGALSELHVRREVWIDPRTRVHQLHSQRYAHYFMVTYFDDGSAVLTYGVRQKRLSSSARLRIRSATRGISEEFDAHMEAADQWAKNRGAVPLAVDDVETAARMVRHFWTVVAPRDVAPSVLRAFVRMSVRRAFTDS